jgi:(1->4)-alpha-D-glucan 1-alpha-D-glucosylmutase
MNKPYRSEGVPDRNAEYLFYQTLVGAWPLPLDRVLAYMQKAACEAKEHTNWTDRGTAYEAALSRFVTSALGNPRFIGSLERFVSTLVIPGCVNSLTQVLLKLTTPGVPDLYQGTELWDFSLVDPDNRRSVDFARRREALLKLRLPQGAEGRRKLVAALLQAPTDGPLKLFVTRLALKCRQRASRLFEEGRYVPLLVAGTQSTHVCAFARVLSRAMAIVVVPRLVLGLQCRSPGLPLGQHTWGDTRLVMPQNLACRALRNVFTSQRLQPISEAGKPCLPLEQVLRDFPIALLEPADKVPPRASAKGFPATPHSQRI